VRRTISIVDGTGWKENAVRAHRQLKSHLAAQQHQQEGFGDTRLLSRHFRGKRINYDKSRVNLLVELKDT